MRAVFALLICLSMFASLHLFGLSVCSSSSAESAAVRDDLVSDLASDTASFERSFDSLAASNSSAATEFFLNNLTALQSRLAEESIGASSHNEGEQSAVTATTPFFLLFPLFRADHKNAHTHTHVHPTLQSHTYPKHTRTYTQRLSTCSGITQR